MKRFRFLLASSMIAGGTAVSAISVHADDEGTQQRDPLARMMQLDRNEDGKISQAEMPERLEGMFTRADADEDGFLTKEEIKTAFQDRAGRGRPDGARDGEGRPGRPEGMRRGRGGDGERGGRGPGDRGPGNRERGDRGPGDRPGGDRERMDRDQRRPDGAPMTALMTALDKDKDGKISKAEIENAVVALKALDRNDDGVLDGEELRPQRDGARGPEGRRPGGRDAAEGGRGGMRGEGGRPDPSQFFDRMDKDGDGKLTGDEIPERMAGALDRIDTNGDKSIDKDEMKAMMERFSGRGRGRGPGAEGGRGRGPEGRPGRGGDRPEGGQGKRPQRPQADGDVT